MKNTEQLEAALQQAVNGVGEAEARLALARVVMHSAEYDLLMAKIRALQNSATPQESEA